MDTARVTVPEVYCTLLANLATISSCLEGRKETTGVKIAKLHAQQQTSTSTKQKKISAVLQVPNQYLLSFFNMLKVI